MARLVFVLGGARSGKSRFAQQLAGRLGGDKVLFVATAEAGDAEMARRIAMHQRDRPATWTTLEQSIHLGAALDEAPPHFEVVLIDCLTLLVSNVLLNCDDPTDVDAAEQVVQAEIKRLVTSVRGRRGVVIVISSEVGLGLVPENSLGRTFRDLLGWANQTVAREAAETYLMVAGLALEARSLATSVERAAHRAQENETNDV